jgi:hypothetical protein
VSTDTRLERVSATTYRIRTGPAGATRTASRFASTEPGAAKAYPPSRFAGRPHRVIAPPERGPGRN